MTAREIIAAEYASNPGRSMLAVGDGGRAVGAWSDSLGRFVMVAGELINGRWAHMPGLMVNGVPLVNDWEAVQP